MAATAADPYFTLKKLLLAGAAGGAGLASADGLTNWLKSLCRDASEDNSKDDGVVYVNLPRTKAAASLLKPGLELTGGILAAGGGYALVHKLVDALKARQAQERLDKAQQVYVNSVEDEAAQKGAAAGRAPSLGEGVFSAASAVPILLAIASGALTYNSLEKNFPAPKPTTNRAMQPRKIVLRYADQPAPEDLSPEEAEELKAGSFELTQEDIDDAQAFVFRSTHALVKASGVTSDFDDLIGAVQSGQYSALSSMISQGIGGDPVLDAVKGASTAISPATSTAAYALLSKSAGLLPMASTLAAAELLELAPLASTAGAGIATGDAAIYKLACLTKALAECERGVRLEEALSLEPTAKAAAAIDASDPTAGELPPVSVEELEALLAHFGLGNSTPSPATSTPSAVSAGGTTEGQGGQDVSMAVSSQPGA